MKNDSLYVTHSEDEIIKNRDIESLYLKPIRNALELGFRNELPLQFLIDIKSDAKSTLQKLIEILKNYPEIIENPSIELVISGNRPLPEEYINYPSYINFDYQSLEPIENPKIWDKISMISLSFKKISEWNGKGRLVDLDYSKIRSIIDKAHSYNKPFR
ncbi:MAG: alkaline phosphatase, partial [Flavobacteriaceae bacterium]|nr:alkaline phosphatase [Flavobacteriaceae bacterium]